MVSTLRAHDAQVIPPILRVLFILIQWFDIESRRFDGGNNVVLCCRAFYGEDFGRIFGVHFPMGNPFNLGDGGRYGLDAPTTIYIRLEFHFSDQCMSHKITSNGAECFTIVPFVAKVPHRWMMSWVEPLQLGVWQFSR